MLIRDRREKVDLALAVALATITGYVDAIGLTRLFGVFPANQSGNVVLFGIAIGSGHATGAVAWWRPALAMAGFALGVFVGYRAGRVLPERHRRAAVLAGETVVLAAFALVVGDVLHAHVPMGGGDEVVALALVTVAMGLQTVALGHVAGVAVSTTYQSSAIVRISESAADSVQRADARRVLVILTTVVACYSGGAALGTLLQRHWGGALWLPVLAVAGCAGVSAATTPDHGRDAPRGPTGESPG